MTMMNSAAARDALLYQVHSQTNIHQHEGRADDHRRGRTPISSTTAATAISTPY